MAVSRLLQLVRNFSTSLDYNTIIRVHSQSGSPEKSLIFYLRMRRCGLRGDAFTSSFVVKSCERLSHFCLGKQLHSTILRDGQQSDTLLLTCLMRLYAASGSLFDACNMFDEMPKRDTIAWNVMISCLISNKRTKDAISIFDIMQGTTYNAKPDDVTCLYLLQACAHLGALDFGERIHRYIEEHGYGDDIKLGNSLVNMYSRCGNVDEAYRVFSQMHERTVVSWSTMISGLAMNGNGRDAIEAFEAMRSTGVAPDEQTFTGVLSACSHCRLVDNALKYFNMMRFEYGIVPNVHHYGCLVDVLGRAGLLEQAYKLVIDEMVEVKPDSTIWRTLLGACRIYGHVELGEHVLENLIELKAQQAGYVLLLNMYSSAGKWEKVAEMRRFMKVKAIQTTPGCSTIELKGVVHEFVVDDELHPHKKEIYEMLDELEKQLKIAGYVINVDSELHDMDIKKKESALSYHSEKLAIAFGMVATPPGTTLRIAKNLRICVDCHNFCKVLSGAYNRKLIVRDRSRFHHFKEGLCSCNDYW